MKLPTLTPAEYKKEWAKLIEENARLRKHLARAEEDVSFENSRYGDAVALRMLFIDEHKLNDEWAAWLARKRKQYKIKETDD